MSNAVPFCSTPLFPPALSFALPSPAHQPIIPEGGARQTAVTMRGPVVALASPDPLAVSVVVPALRPVMATLGESALPAGIVTVAGTVATPGRLLDRLTVTAFRVT